MEQMYGPCEYQIKLPCIELAKAYSAFFCQMKFLANSIREYIFNKRGI